MTRGWRLYCRKCDRLSHIYDVGERVPEPTQCDCGHYHELVSGRWIKRNIASPAEEALRVRMEQGAVRKS